MEFQANKFKGREVYPEKHSGVCKCPFWHCMLDEYALCHFLALGTRPSVLLPVFVFVWSCVTYSERRTDPELWLVDSWCLVQGRVRADWNNQSLLFHCPLFHWCLVWRVSGYVACMCRSCKPWIYRVDIIRLPIIKSQGHRAVTATRIKCQKELGLIRGKYARFHSDCPGGSF